MMRVNQIPTTFRKRKLLERQAWKLAGRYFRQFGWSLIALAVDRAKTFPQAEPILSRLREPPVAVMLACLPDGVAIHKPSQRSLLIELKATFRDTFAIRTRDFAAMLMWQSLLVVVHMPTQQIFASFADDLPQPEVVIIPSEQFSPFDAGGLNLLLHRFPDVRQVRGVDVVTGSKAPFALWRVSVLRPIDEILRGDQKW